MEPDELSSDVQIVKSGRNIYHIHRPGRESFGEEYMCAHQRSNGGANMRVQNIYILKRYMLNVCVYQNNELGLQWKAYGSSSPSPQHTDHSRL